TGTEVSPGMNSGSAKASAQYSATMARIRSRSWSALSTLLQCLSIPCDGTVQTLFERELRIPIQHAAGVFCTQILIANLIANLILDLGINVGTHLANDAVNQCEQAELLLICR